MEGEGKELERGRNGGGGREGARDRGSKGGGGREGTRETEEGRELERRREGTREREEGWRGSEGAR